MAGGGLYRVHQAGSQLQTLRDGHTTLLDPTSSIQLLLELQQIRLTYARIEVAAIFASVMIMTRNFGTRRRSPLPRDVESFSRIWALPKLGQNLGPRIQLLEQQLLSQRDIKTKLAAVLASVMLTTRNFGPRRRYPLRWCVETFDRISAL